MKNKKFAFGMVILDSEFGNKVDWNVTNFFLSDRGTFLITIQRYGKVKTLEISTEASEEIGLVNLQALNKFFNQ